MDVDEEVDVYEANASEDEYTDGTGDLGYKTTRDQFLSREYTGIPTSMLSYCSMYIADYCSSKRTIEAF